MLVMFFRTIIMYFVVIIIMRIMGKRQIGELQPSELVVALVIADLAAIPLSSLNIPLLSGIIPILTLFILEELISFTTLKSIRARKLFSGTPSIVIERGLILEKEMAKQRYNINDLLEQLRLNGFPNVNDVEYAIIETSGELSVIPKAAKEPVTVGDMDLEHEPNILPVTVITDGKVIESNLLVSGVDTDWLNKELEKSKIKSPRDVFLGYLVGNKEFHYQLKSKNR